MTDTASRRQMSDSDLCALIDRESRQALGYDDELQQDRQRNMEFYLGEAKGELAPQSVEGRSKVVSKDSLDTVEWMMPSLMRTFAGSDEVIRFEPEEESDEQACADATDYVGYLIHRKNDGFTVLHDAIKSALIQRMGVVKVYCDKRWVTKEERYQGVSIIDLQALKADPEVEVIEEESVQEFGPDGQPVLSGYEAEQVPPELATTYNVLCRRKSQIEEFKCEGVPPEEIRISKDSRDIASLRFIEHRVERTVSDLLSLGYPKDLVDQIPTDDDDSEWGSDKVARHDYDGSDDFGDEEPEPSQRRVILSESYIRVDYDGDGIAEYRRVVKASNVVFENDVADDHPFALFCPLLMPYKLIGLSFVDLVEDLQRIKTALMRQILDNVYLSNNPITEAVEGQVNFDDLLNPRPGGIRRVKAQGMTREVSIPFVAGAGLQIVEQIDGVRQTRTGVTEFNQGVQPDALSKSSMGSEGVQEMIAAGAQRIELVARVFAETGIKRMYLLMLKLVTQYQNRAQQAKINGRWLTIDPREWKNQYDVTVSVGIGHAGRQQKVTNLMLIGQAQERALPLGLATPQNIYNTLTRLAEAVGYKDSDQFFTAPQPGQQPDQGPPPEVQVEQIKQQGAQQLAQIKAQADIQVARMTQEFQAAQAQQETELEAQRDAVKTQNQMELERYKAEMQMQVDIEKARIDQETAIQTAQINAQASVVAAANRPPPEIE